MSKLVLIFVLFCASSAFAQTPCKGGTPTQPACSRTWGGASPLNVLACPSDASLNTDAGVRLYLRELNGTPIVSVLAGTPGGQVTLAAASAPSAPPATRTRVVEFSCDGANVTGGEPTYAAITFPLAAPSRPVAPTVLP